MGNATHVTDLIKGAPLSQTEIDERHEAARRRAELTTTPEGEVVEHVAPTVAPVRVHHPEPSTWD
jgi:hypothetical protein